MSVTISITLPPESQALIQRFEAMPEELPRAIKRGMDSALDVVKDRIILKRLTSKGPFPPAEHRLGVRTGQLRASVYASPATIRDNEITGEIGTPVVYGAVHEFGFNGAVRFKKGPVSRLALMGGRAVRGTSGTRRMNIPERAPFRTGINENTEFIVDEIGDEIEKALTRE